MPCIYCKTIKSPNSSTHSLLRCTESANEIIGPIVTLVTEHTHDIRKQALELSGYSKGQLAMVCKQFNTYFSGSKPFLIAAIIKKFFQSQVIRYASTITSRNVHMFTASYDAVFADEPSELRTLLIEIMELLYQRLFGVRRNGVDIHTFYRPYIAIRAENRARAAASAAASAARAALDADLPVRVYPHLSHLRKLSIQIAVVQVQNKECDICCDSENPTAKMGCSHEFCVGCVNKLCSSRSKSFISCPMCRAEISSIQVSSAEIQHSLNTQILRC
jgi:hypothetical protein